MDGEIRILNGSENVKEVVEGVVVQDEVLSVSVDNVDSMKKKYGEIYQIDVRVDEDDAHNGRNIRFFFKKPTTASFNRYLKTANKNMTASTTEFALDNIIDEQRDIFTAETSFYPGLSLGVGTKLLSALGLSDNINFQKL